MDPIARIKDRLKQRILIPARKSLKVAEYHFNSGEQKFRSRFFADVPVQLSTLDEYRNEYFPNAGPTAWLDRPDWEAQISAKLSSGALTEADAELCRKWARDGYIILKNPYPERFVDETWAAYERAVKTGAVKLEPEPGGPGDRHPGRFLNPHLKVPEMKQMLYFPEILRVVQLLLGKTPAPFQTITSHKGSQQLEHSDSVHMTTYPLGFMCATWTAFEDIHPDSGPLIYYPGSHRQPYYFSRHVGLAPGEFRQRGYISYAEKYEPFIQERVRQSGLKPAHFLASKGDVLFWHANLWHGGSKRNDLVHTRKAMVGHYFAVGAVCYHDLSGVMADDRHGGGAYGKAPVEA